MMVCTVGSDEELPELWSSVVESAGYLGDHLVHLDSVFSRVCPEAVGLCFEVWLLFWCC